MTTQERMVLRSAALAIARSMDVRDERDQQWMAILADVLPRACWETATALINDLHAARLVNAAKGSRALATAITEASVSTTVDGLLRHAAARMPVAPAPVRPRLVAR